MKEHDMIRVKATGERGTIVTIYPNGAFAVCLMTHPYPIRDFAVSELEKDDSFARNDRFRKRNYDLCSAINLISLHVVCDELIRRGADPAKISGLMSIANETLQLLRGINGELEKDLT